MASGRCGSVPFAVVLALTCMAVLPLVATRAAAQVPGGFVELATSVNVRPLLTANEARRRTAEPAVRRSGPAPGPPRWPPVRAS